MARVGGQLLQITEDFACSLQKDYTREFEALSEVMTNSFFAKGVSRILVDKRMYRADDKSVPCLNVVNNGEFFNQKDLNDKFHSLGCDSEKTAGNQNGVGLKSSLLYHMNGNSNAFGVVVSKSQDGQFSYALMNSRARVYMFDELDDADKKYINYLIDKFLSPISEGTVVSVYDADHLDQFNITEYTRLVNEQYTKMLTKVDFSFCDNDYGEQQVQFQNLFYTKECPNDDNFRVVVPVNYTWNPGKVRGEVRGERFFEGFIEVFNLEGYENSPKYGKMNKYDSDVQNKRADERFWGVRAEYDNGYCPLYAGHAYLIGKDWGGEYNNLRVRIVLKPSDEPHHANIQDIQKFYDELGGVNSAKVQARKRCQFISPKKGGKSAKGWEKVQSGLIDKILEVMNRWAKKTEMDFISSDELNNFGNFKDDFHLGSKKENQKCQIVFKDFDDAENKKLLSWKSIQDSTDSKFVLSVNSKYPSFAEKKRSFIYGKIKMIQKMLKVLGTDSSDLTQICDYYNSNYRF